jgi:phosphotransferase system enzyme I (PtsI)
VTFSIHGLAVARGIAIGRAVLVASSRVDVAHYFIEPSQVEAEIERVRSGRDAVVNEIHRLQASISHMGPKEAPQELTALLDVHLMASGTGSGTACTTPSGRSPRNWK